jgi:hypothetical protein
MSVLEKVTVLWYFFQEKKIRFQVLNFDQLGNLVIINFLIIF